MAPAAPLLHHLGLSVTDAEASLHWYERLFGPGEVIQREGPGWIRRRLICPNGLLLSFTQHDAAPFADRFDPARVGMDHIGYGCSSEQEVYEWAARLDELGIERGPVEDPPYAWTVTARDPDNIPVEFFCPRPTA